jgi:hypothetical protein
MTKLTEVEFHIKPYEVAEYFQMLKDNGQNGALKEFWITARYGFFKNQIIRV